MNAIVQKVSNISEKTGEIMERKSWILPSILSVVLFVMAVWGIGNFNQLLLYDDEFGYWAASAYLTGTDWKSVTSGIPYYSYGYGFLILTPIRLIFSSTTLMYQAAIAANGLLLVASYWIARTVAGQLFEETNRVLLDIVCFVVMLYPSNLVFSHIAWAECLLVFVFWVFVWTSLRVIRKPSIANHIGLAAVTMGLYVVHQRTIAIPIATVMVLLWQFVIDKSRRKYIIAFAVVFAVLMGLHCFIKTDLINTYYDNNSKMDLNNMEGQTVKLKAIFTWTGFWDLVKSMLGKWFYLFVATLMMAWWGAGELFRQAASYREMAFPKKKKQRTKKLSDLSSLSGELSLWYTWLLLAFAGNFMVAAIYMGIGGRNDTLLYGRYTEYMIGIYFVTGVIVFLKDEKWLSKAMIYMQITLFCGWYCQNILNKLNITAYQFYHSVCTSPFLEKGSKAEGAVLGFAFQGFAISVLLMLILKMKSWKSFDWVKGASVALSVAVMFSCISYPQVFGVMSEKQDLRISNITSIISKIDWLDEDASQKVYFFKDTESRYWSESFQFLMKDTPLAVISSEEINLEEDAFYIVGNGFLSSKEFKEQFYCVHKSNQFALIVNTSGELAQKARGLTGGQG